MKAIEAYDLSKKYSSGKNAVDRINLSIEHGEVFGFLGPNGAGKTTTVKLLNGMLTATGGSIQVFGMNPATQAEQIHAISGVLTEHAGMYDQLTGIENLIFYGEAFGIDRAESESRGRELLEQLELTDAADQKLGAYSTGMRQRLSLARAMIHHPKLLFLDEPTSGLDPESTQSVNQLIHRLAKEEGMTIFLCTHQLRYAQEICTSYGLIDNGRLLATGDLEYLRSLVFSGLKVLIRSSLMIDSIPNTIMEDGSFEVEVNAEGEIPGIVRQIVQAGGDVYEVTSRKLSLEEIYFALLEKKGVTANV